MTGKRGAIACVVIALVLATLGLNAQPNGQAEREEMYRQPAPVSIHVTPIFFWLRHSQELKGEQPW